jgi:anaerobic ribonucleoside-triphosphate reductase activating protein
MIPPSALEPSEELLAIHDAWVGSMGRAGDALYLWVQGCPKRCPGCFNVAAQPFDGFAAVIDPETIAEYCAVNHLHLLLSGGEPFVQASGLGRACRGLRSRHPGALVVAYSGYRFEELTQMPDAAELLAWVDLLIDGPFLVENPCADPLRGSANQCVIDLSGRMPESFREVMAIPKVQLELETHLSLRIVGTGFGARNLDTTLKELERYGLEFSDP